MTTWRVFPMLVVVLTWLLIGLGPSVSATQKRSTVWDGVYTAAQAERGQAAFVKSCGGCHRDDMSGGDDSEPPLRGSHFTDKWEGASVAEIYDFVANNMPKSKPGSLPLDTCIDIVSFILKSNDMPPGQSELTTDIEKLNQIVFTAKRP
jgi:cytochrome c